MPTALKLDDQSIELDTRAAHLRPELDDDTLPEPSFFADLASLDSWADLRSEKLASAERDDGILLSQRGEKGLIDVKDVERYLASAFQDAAAPSQQQDADRPQLMVCHDHKGGYKEHPDQRCYTFEHWQLADYFVYFSHQRVTVPPPAYIKTGHRHGTKVLGTVIFEWKESIPDLSLLLRGPDCEYLPLPTRVAAGARNLPVLFSPHYADALITLALDRDFDGYLINVEVPLELGFQCSGETWPWWVQPRARSADMRQNAQRLRAWVAYLTHEGRRRVRLANEAAPPGGRLRTWHVSWYDSVTVDGNLAWQDALTPANASFFEVADSVFTNYTWAGPPEKLPPGQFPQPELRYTGEPSEGGFHPALRASAALAARMGRKKSEVFIGIDVFARNCYGGLDTWKSLEMIMPHRPDTAAQDTPGGLSVALFAPGWTWEHDEPSDLPGRRGWPAWWEEEQVLWRKRAGAGERAQPIGRYFRPRTWARALRPFVDGTERFYSNFATASGTRWWDRGACVRDWSAPGSSTKDAIAGWTDVAVSMPQPEALFSGTQAVEVAFDVRAINSDVWSGTTAIRISVQHRQASTVFVPIFTVALQGHGSGAADSIDVQASVVVKVVVPADRAPSCRIKPHLQTQGADEVKPESDSRSASSGWTEMSARLQWKRSAPAGNFEGRLGLLITFDASASDASEAEFLVGSISLHAPKPQALDQDEAAEATLKATSGGLSLLEWKDTEPSAPYYQLYVRDSTSGAERWLCTATRERGRTEAAVPASSLGTDRTVIARPLL